MATEHGIRTTIDVAGESYEVLDCKIVERLDHIPRLEARLWKDGGIPKPATLLDAVVAFQIGRIESFDAGRHFKGIVVEAERRIDSANRPYVRIVVCPKLWNLTKRTDLRTFQNKSVPDIVKEVLDAAGVTKSKLNLAASYDPREYVVQYRETDFDFILRLMSEEGIAFAFDHETEEVVFFDDPHGLGSAPDATMPYRPEFGFEQIDASVQKVSEVAKVVSDKVYLREYDFNRPRFTVEGDAESADEGGHALETYVFPARSVKEGTVKRYAQVLLDAIQCRRDTVRGATTSWSLAPGFRFTIEEHPFDGVNAELLTVGTTLEHEDERSPIANNKVARTSLSFDAIPTAKSSYRPERRARARELAGVQTGVTTGASGQEVHCDKAGRVHVLFPWDRVGKKDETASMPFRTLQLPTGGSMLLPRVGWEVFVQNDEGDVDLPLVMGRLYNAEKPPPYALPGGAARSSLQTATTPGGGSTNELRTDDTKGKEEMFFNASKDMTVLVNHNETEGIGNNATMKVGSNQTIDITNSLTTNVGADQSIDVGGNQVNAVETFKVDQCTDHSYDIGGNRDMKVGGDHKHTIGASESIDIGSMLTELVVGKVSEGAGGNLTLDVGGARVSLTAAAYNTTVGGAHTESIGAAKIVVSFGGVSSDAGGDSMLKIAGAKVNLVDADRSEKAGGMFTEVAAGLRQIKATNITFEAESALTLVMGASILSLTPATVAFLGLSVKLDGATAETAALVLDN